MNTAGKHRGDINSYYYCVPFGQTEQLQSVVDFTKNSSIGYNKGTQRYELLPHERPCSVFFYPFGIKNHFFSNLKILVI